MKTLIKVALFAAAISIFLHLYLAMHYYPLKFGFSTGPSICSINTTFDCDAVSASSYAAFLGIPMAVWGMMTNAVLFILILISWWQWGENPERIKRWAVALSGFSALSSITMALISALFLRNYCVFCITLYVLSFIIFECLRRTQKEPFFANFFKEIPGLWSESKVIAIPLILIPVGAYLINQAFILNYGAGQLNSIVHGSISEWKEAPSFKFMAQPTLVMGADEAHAKLTLKEFADFRCSHCRHAAHPLHAFVESHPTVRLEFYTFPLDGQCNPGIPSGNGESCKLAEAVYCAQKQGQGWALHDSLYKHQPEINELENADQVVTKVKQLAERLKINVPAMSECMNQPSTEDAIRNQAKQGNLVQVQGTPTIFANNRSLPGAQLLPVLDAALKSVSQ